MKGFRGLSMAVALAGVLGLNCGAKAQTGDLNSVLKQMDAASGKFKSAQSDVKREQYEAAVRDTTTQTGSTYLERIGSGMQWGMKLNPPAAKIVEMKDGILRMFDPESDHLTQISLKNNQAQYESFLALGFGGSGSDLAKQWTITYKGSSQMNDGAKNVTVAELDLVAKDPKARQNFSHITLWIDPVQDVSLKQKFFLPSGDAQTATYTNIRLNQLDKSAIAVFAIKTDKKTTVENH
jgi:outer membrane lipoprotein-sorting protein